MAVTFRSKSAVFNSVGTSPTATEPASAASGDALLALYLCDSGGGPTLPASWTSLYNGTQGAVTWRVGYIIRGGSAPSYAFTHTGSIYRELHVLCYQGSAAITLDSQSSSGASGSAIAHNPDPPATTAVASSSRSVTGGINYGGSAVAWVAGAGYTINSDNTTGNDGVIASKALASAGSEDPAAFTGEVSAGFQDYWDGFTVTFTDVSSAPTTAQTIPAIVQALSGQMVGLRYLDGQSQRFWQQIPQGYRQPLHQLRAGMVPPLQNGSGLRHPSGSSGDRLRLQALVSPLRSRHQAWCL